MAHEFSHILNYELKDWFNIWYSLHLTNRASNLDSGDKARYFRDEEDNRGKFYIFGLGLFIIGIVGAYLGAFIRSAVRRQKEFLADF